VGPVWVVFGALWLVDHRVALHSTIFEMHSADFGPFASCLEQAATDSQPEFGPADPPYYGAFWGLGQEVYP
jgi:hypothetical protein